MNIVIICNHILPFTNEPIGGAEKLIYSLAKNFTLQNHNVKIFSRTQEGIKGDKLYNQIKYEFVGPNVGNYKFSKLFRELLFSYKIYKKVKNIDCDVVLAFHYASLFFSKSLKKKCIYYPFHDSFTETGTKIRRRNNQTKFGLIKSFFSEQIHLFLLKQCLKKSEIVLTEGGFQNEMMINKKFFHPNLVEFGVSIDIDAITGVVSAEKNLLNVNHDFFNIITVNRLEPVKGNDLLIKAFSLLQSRIPKCRLYIVGDGSEMEYLKTLVKETNLQDRIYLMGRLNEEEMYNLVYQCHLYVSPTFHEDWVMGIAEAMALGKPIISTGQKWLVKDSENGFIAKIGDYESLCDKILQYFNLDNHQKFIFSQNSKTFVKEYDIKSLSHKFIKIVTEQILNS